MSVPPMDEGQPTHHPAAPAGGEGAATGGREPAQLPDSLGGWGAHPDGDAARRRLAFLAAASVELASSLDYETTLRNVARLAVPRIADWCFADLYTEDGTLRRLALAHADPAQAPLAQELLRHALPGADGVLSRVLGTGRSELFETIPAGTSVIAGDVAGVNLLRRMAPRSAIVVPLLARGRTLGAVSFVTAQSERRFGPDDLALTEDLARRIALAVDNARLYREAQEARDQLARQAARLNVLAEASRAFAEARLDLPALLEAIARRVVETLGDVCVIRLLSDDGRRLEPVAMYHPDPEALAFGRAMVDEAPEGVDEGLNGRVMRSGRPLLIPVVDQRELRDAIKPEYRPYLERFGTHSVLIVPVRVRGQILGVLSAARETPGRPYTADDQAFLQELADRAAQAIDNARLYRQSQEAIRARDQFLSIASHELRTPITTLQGYTELLIRAHDRGRPEPARVRRYLRGLDDGTKRLAAMTQDLLDVSRLHSGQFPLQPRPFDLAALVTRVAGTFADRLDARHTLTAEAPAPCPTVGDPDRLEQVLTNLLENAVKYSPDGGTVSVTLRPDGAGLLLTVRDEGIGLPPGLAEAIFVPFGRAPNATGRQIPGLGLGLHICRDIVERHGGRIWAESAGEDRGAAVNVWLPAGDANGQAGDEGRAVRPERSEGACPERGEGTSNEQAPS